MKIANEIAEAYINDQLEAKYEVTRRSGSWLQLRIEELRQQASDAYRAVQDYKTANNIMVDTEGKLSTDRQIGELTDALGRARTEVSTAEAKLQRIENILNGGTTFGSADPAVADVLNNPIITRLRGQYLDAQKREAGVDGAIWQIPYGDDQPAHRDGIIGTRHLGGSQKNRGDLQKRGRNSAFRRTFDREPTERCFSTCFVNKTISSQAA